MAAHAAVAEVEEAEEGLDQGKVLEAHGGHAAETAHDEMGHDESGLDKASSAAPALDSAVEVAEGGHGCSLADRKDLLAAEEG